MSPVLLLLLLSGSRFGWVCEQGLGPVLCSPWTWRDREKFCGGGSSNCRILGGSIWNRLTRGIYSVESPTLPQAMFLAPQAPLLRFLSWSPELAHWVIMTQTMDQFTRYEGLIANTRTSYQMGFEFCALDADRTNSNSNMLGEWSSDLPCACTIFAS